MPLKGRHWRVIATFKRSFIPHWRRCIAEASTANDSAGCGVRKQVFVLQTKSTRKRIRSVQCSFYATSSHLGSLTAWCWGACVSVPTFWYRLNQADRRNWVVLDKQPLNGCCCCSMISKTYVRARRTYCVSWLRGSITVLTAVAKLTLPHGLLRGCTVMDTEDLAASIWPPPLSASTRWRRISYHKKYTHLYTAIGEVIMVMESKHMQ